MKKIFFSLLLLNFYIAPAQSWFEGSLVLSNDEVLVGEISLEDKHDLLLFRHGGTRMVYPAHQVKSLYFYDARANINRRFISVKNEDGLRISYQLYEVVISGEVTVLRRKKLSAFSNHVDAVDFNYFAWYKDVLSPLVKFTRTIFPKLLLRIEGSVENLIAKNKLNGNSTASSIQFIDFYNALDRKAEPLAKN